MAYGSAISQALPTVSSTVGPTYATNLRAWCVEVEACIEAKVTPAGMSIDTNLDINSKKLLNVESLQLESLSVSTASTNQVYVVSGNLYFSNGSGIPVKITAGSAINVAATGGFTGDYAADGDAGAHYYGTANIYAFFQNEATSLYATATLGSLKLVGTAIANPSYGITVFPSTLSESWGLALPAAAPTSSGSLATFSDAGVMAFSKTITLTTLSTTGAAYFGGAVSAAATLDVTGAVTASAYHYTTDVVRCISPFYGAKAADSPDIYAYYTTSGSNLAAVHFSATAGTGDIYLIPLDLEVGQRIKSVSVRTEKTSGTTDALVMSLCSMVLASGIFTVVGSDTSVTTVAKDLLTYTPGSPITIESSTNYFLRVYKTGATDAMKLYGALLVHDKP